MLNRDLTNYNQLNRTPFHMPGHKRQNLTGVELPYQKDYTEVEGLDDLHHADGILKEAMDRTAELYGVDRTWYLVGGSTVGNLAGIYALAPYGSEVICTRVMHRSIVHGLMMAGYEVHYVMPEYVEELGCYGGVKAETVRQALEQYPDSKAVILTSPTYEGILSEVKEIVELAHKAGIPVLVDEAHGSHLDVHFSDGSHSDFPEGAVAAGADVVVQSAHKTLISMTQTAWMHLQGSLVSSSAIDEALDLFETSSPSYVLMNSLDACTDYVGCEGKTAYEKWLQNLLNLQKCGKNFHNLKLKVYNEDGDGYRKDPSKILIYTGEGQLSGYAIAEKLREIYNIETEMATDRYCLAMSGLGDDESSFAVLANALKELDGSLTECVAVESSVESGNNTADGNKMMEENHVQSFLSDTTQIRYTLTEAAHQEKEEIEIVDAAGHICGEEVFCYPPGIPIVLPGEVITEELKEYLSGLDKCGKLRHGKKHLKDGMITVLKE